MIYEINSKDVDYCKSIGCFCICFCDNSPTALISSPEKLTGVEIIAEYQQTEINEVMMLDKWKKLCKDCS